MLQPTPMEWVTVKTTLPAVPYPLLDGRPDIRTARLVLRRTLESDLAGWHALRLQPEVMQWTSQGHPDRDVEWSRERLQGRLAPEGDAKYEFIICLADTGEMIGTGGCHMVVGELGWPVIGYMLRKEFWGRGYATELVNGFLEAWWALPRAEVELKVEKSTVGTTAAAADADADDALPLVEERIVAVTLDSNDASQNVLRKCKLDLVKVWEEDDLRDPTQRAVLYGFTGRKPSS
ncbi:GCN5-related N-acetyltransferase (GNAT) domain-containingprotein [Purpureocillium lavendulum]|uniref:GCN5-related N-acetyltransferase (GNAT) domain-containingprotein n=1 Tax=Purpureocillium lavendulum TaxID=1247861 RepID=A0AB34FXI9_9HYPO|nr:GCN5-related N-acetyltransferase (GNAT) domain-containingprotein [Purpureocillium lavendulum]